MKDKILQIITEEDKQKPYTDEKLVNMLGIKREQVTLAVDGKDCRFTRRKPLL